MSITVIQQGLLDTFQDLGRAGYRHLGINISGAMDTYAMQTANLLLGNEPGEPVLELHFPAAAFEIHSTMALAVCGADFVPELDGQRLSLNQPFVARAGAMLRFTRRENGQRAYLAVRGGWQLNEWLGSCSTQLQIHRGGYHGRALQKGDVVLLKTTSFSNQYSKLHLPWRTSVDYGGAEDTVLWVIPARDWPQLTEQAQELFQQSPFTISPQADRMGYRLTGPALERVHTQEMLSGGVHRGAIQLLPDGQLITLAADHQVTGGYPVIGYIITVHQPALAQLGPGMTCRFRLTDLATAENLLRQRYRDLRLLQWACRAKWDTWIHQHKNA